MIEKRGVRAIAAPARSFEWLVVVDQPLPLTYSDTEPASGDARPPRRT